MKDFLSIQNVDSIADLVQLALDVKKQPLAYKNRGMGKTLGLVFFNPSLRTRMSSQKAAYNLGMNVIVMNINSDGWALEWEDGTVMDEGSQEHIKEAAGVLSQYCDIIGVRSFPSLKSRCDDYSEKVIRSFKKHASKPIISLESATRHPLQGFTDLVTILERSVNKLPRVVLTWAPHPKVLPQAVANSFVTWMKAGGVLLSIANPPGFDLDPELKLFILKKEEDGHVFWWRPHKSWALASEFFMGIVDPARGDRFTITDKHEPEPLHYFPLILSKSFWQMLGDTENWSLSVHTARKLGLNSQQRFPRFTV